LIATPKLKLGNRDVFQDKRRNYASKPSIDMDKSNAKKKAAENKVADQNNDDDEVSEEYDPDNSVSLSDVKVKKIHKRKPKNDTESSNDMLYERGKPSDCFYLIL
jgi:hypothetical protein